MSQTNVSFHPDPLPVRFRITDAGPWIFLSGGIALTIITWIQAAQDAETADSLRLASLLERSTTNIEARLREHEALIRATVSFMEANGLVDRDQYNQFVLGTGLTESYPGASVLGFAPVETAASARFIRSLVNINPTYPWPANKRKLPRRMVVMLAAPETPDTRPIIGFDMYSSQTRRPFLQRAVESGELVFTPRLELVKTPRADDPIGFLIYKATYAPGLPIRSPNERWKAVRGLVYSPFRAKRFFDLSLQEPDLRAVNVQVFDGNIGKENLLYDSRRTPSPGAITTASVVKLPNRTWQIRATPTREFFAESPLRFIPLVPILGGILTGLAFSLAWIQRSARRRSDADAHRLRAEVEERQRAEIEVRHLNERLEGTVQLRTEELRLANKEMEAFVYSVSHDLRAPLRAIDGFSQVVLEDYGDRIEDDGRDALNRVRRASRRMDNLISALLTLSRVTRAEIQRQPLNLSRIATEVSELIVQAQDPGGVSPQVDIQEGLAATGDERLIHIVMDNLIGNAVKFSRKVAAPHIEIGQQDDAFFARDNGVGFNQAHAEKLFQPFERLHTEAEFVGTGIGLATVQRIIHRHGGTIWAESELGKGATFYFTLPRDA